MPWQAPWPRLPDLEPAPLLPAGLLDSPPATPTPPRKAEKRPREYHHSRVPKTVNLQEEYESQPAREITTLMRPVESRV